MMILESKLVDSSAMPVTLDEAKAHLKVDGTAEDSLITIYIKAATSLCESYTGVAFTTQTRSVALDYFPYNKGIPLPYGPVTEVTSFDYFDSDDVEQTLVVDDGYSIDDTGSLYTLNAIDVWPDGGTNAIVTYTTGFATTPSLLKMAVLQCVADLYEKRQGEGEPLSWSIRTILDPYKVYWSAYV